MQDCKPLSRRAPLLSATAPASTLDLPAKPAGHLNPFVSIVVPVYNDAESLATLLSALDEQDYDPDRFECVIVDNGSDEPVMVCDHRNYEFRVLREPKAGSYAARNCGLREARGDILIFTDADCMPRSDWLSSAIRHFVSARGPSILAGILDVLHKTETSESALGWHSVVNDLDQARFVNRYHFAATANMATTQEVFENVGQFNPALLSGGDFEWGQRAWTRGIRLKFCEDVVVRHPARADWKSLVAKTRRIAGGHYGLNQQHRQPLRATIHATLEIAAVSLRRSWFDPRLPTLFCRLRVLTVEVVLRVIQLCEVLRLGLGGQPCRR